MAFFFGGAFGLTVEPLTIDQLANMFVMYGIGWTAAFSCLALMYLHARRRREVLGLDDLDAFDAVTHARHYFGYALVGAVSIAIALAHVGVRVGLPGWAFALMGPISWWNGTTRARRRERLAAVRVPAGAVHPGSERPAVLGER
jgi:hypothetical protein